MFQYRTKNKIKLQNKFPKLVINLKVLINEDVFLWWKLMQNISSFSTPKWMIRFCWNFSDCDSHAYSPSIRQFQQSIWMNSKRKENWEQTNYYLADVLHAYQIQPRDVCCLVLMRSSKTISVCFSSLLLFYLWSLKRLVLFVEIGLLF